MNRRVILVSVATGEVRPATLAVDGSGEGALEFTPDGRQLLVNGQSNCWLWEWTSTNAAVPLPARMRDARRAAFSRDGRRLATSGPDGVCVWEFPSLTFLGRLPFAFGRAWYVSFPADSNTLATGYGLGGNSKLWHIPSQRELITFEAARAMQFSPDDRLMAILESKGISFIRVPTLAEIDADQTEDAAVRVRAALEDSASLDKPGGMGR